MPGRAAEPELATVYSPTACWEKPSSTQPFLLTTPRQPHGTNLQRTSAGKTHLEQTTRFGKHLTPTYAHERRTRRPNGQALEFKGASPVGTRCLRLPSLRREAPQ